MITDLRIIHWDYKELERVGTAETEIQMLSGAVKDTETKAKVGFYLRWAVRIIAAGELTLSCIAESTHKADVNEISPPVFMRMIQVSLNDFKEVFGQRIKETNITVSVEVDVVSEETAVVLQQLREQ